MRDNIFHIGLEDRSTVDVRSEFRFDRWVAVFGEEVGVEGVQSGGIEWLLAAKDASQVKLG